MAGEITAMTWNVENLFRPGDPSGPSSETVYRAKLDYLATIVGAAAPNVVALQEVGHLGAGNDLVARLGPPWQLALSHHPDRRGIRVGILTPHPITPEADLSAFPAEGMSTVPDVDGDPLRRMGRGVLQVRVTLPDGRALRVLSAHLKSKLLTYPGGRRFPKSEDERARGAGFALMRRAAEAAAIRVHLNAEMRTGPPVPTVLAGDFNDGPDAVTSVMLTGPADGDPNRPDLGDPVRLYNLADRLPRERAFSRIFRGRGELIDHLMVSRDLLLGVRSMDALVEGIDSITESVERRADAVVPDHAPVVARFALP